MLSEIEFEETLDLVKGIDIPARPVVIQQITEMQEKGDVGLHEIAQIISQDVSLSAAILKAVNSPLFGLPKKIISISQAATLLGLNNVINIVIGISLQLEISGRFNVAVERFWDTANDVALMSAGIAQDLGNVPADQAYTVGLFHDCGIPLLMLAYDHYVDVLKDVNNHPDKTMVEVEQGIMLTNHAAVGYYVAKTWGLSRRICLCILNHHERDMLSSEDKLQNNLIANLKLAESMSHTMRGRGANPEWERIQDYILDYLNISLDDYEVLSETMIERIQSHR